MDQNKKDIIQISIQTVSLLVTVITLIFISFQQISISKANLKLVEQSRPFSYHYKFPANKKNIYAKEDGTKTEQNIPVPDIEVNVDSGLLRKFTIFVFQDNQIINISNMDQKDAITVDMDDPFESNQFIASLGDIGETFIGLDNKAYENVFVLLEGRNGEKNLDMVCIDVDFDKAETNIRTYSQYEILNKDSQEGKYNSTEIQQFQDFSKLRKLLMEEDLI